VKKVRLQCLVHDLETLRRSGKLGAREISRLGRFHEIIVHTDAMRTLLQQGGIPRNKMKVLTFFDYLAEASPDRRTLSYNICFAGNLGKSGFVKELTSLHCDRLCFRLYGINFPDMQQNDNIHYEGVFAPDDIKGIKGSWGLVWDGDSLDTCTGMMGNYLRFNSSHKISLYLALGMPLIVWSESSVASLVKHENIGVAVSSLADVEKVIDGIDPAQYKAMLENVAVYSSKIRSGQMLGRLLWGQRCRRHCATTVAHRQPALR